MNQVVKFISLLILFGVVIFFIICRYHEWLNQSCYEKCSDFHVMVKASHWEFSDYLIVEADTIWIDKECMTHGVFALMNVISACVVNFYSKL